MAKLVLTSIFLTLLSLTCAANLEVVHDEELLNLIKSENYVIVLFGKSLPVNKKKRVELIRKLLARRDCEACDNYENELTALRDDLVDSLNAWVVKVIDSQLTRLYSPTKEPILVFFRHGVPLLYDGKNKKTQISASVANCFFFS